MSPTRSAPSASNTPATPETTTSKTRSKSASRPGHQADITNRITARDAAMLRLIAEHRVLTSSQLTAALFAEPGKTRARIGILRAAGLVETFRPPAVRNPPLYCVATAKAVKLLGTAADTIATPPTGPKAAATAAALRPDLEHLRGVNEFFCRLLAAARARPEAALEQWRSEWSTAKLFPARVRPDGFGRWRDGQEWSEFFLEYDTGTEPLHRLVAKIAGYADLLRTADTCSPVLFWLRTPGREQHLHALLADLDLDDVVCVATAVGDPATADISGPVWRPTFTTRTLTLAALGQAACDHLGVSHRPNVL